MITTLSLDVFVDQTFIVSLRNATGRRDKLRDALTKSPSDLAGWIFCLGGSAHAMLLSPHPHRVIQDMEFSNFMPHDVVLYSRLNILTPTRPIAAQRHTRTVYSKTYDPLRITSGFMWLLGFDRDPFHAYDAFHRIGRMGGLLRVIQLKN